MLSFTAHSQIVPSGIIKAFEKGNAKDLALFFHDNLEMKLLNENYVSSKNQSMRIMQDFFKSYPPVSFKVNYEDSKKESKYGSGTLISKNASFRVNIYFLDIENEKIIYYLSIEKI